MENQKKPSARVRVYCILSLLCSGIFAALLYANAAGRCCALTPLLFWALAAGSGIFTFALACLFFDAWDQRRYVRALSLLTFGLIAAAPVLFMILSLANSPALRFAARQAQQIDSPASHRDARL